MPILIQLGLKWFAKPNVQIVVGDTAELGYSTLLTVCNVQAAIRVQRKPALVTGIELLLIHENGRRLELAWNGLSEVISTFEGSGGERGAHTRTVPAVATLIRPDTDLFLRKVMFNDRVASANMTALGGELARRISNLGIGATLPTIQQTDEYVRIRDAHHDRFGWEPGNYVATLSVTVAELNRPVKARFSFTLSQANVTLLRGNVALLDRNLESLVTAALNGQTGPTMPTFSWLNPIVKQLPIA